MPSIIRRKFRERSVLQSLNLEKGKGLTQNWSKSSNLSSKNRDIRESKWYRNQLKANKSQN